MNYLDLLNHIIQNFLNPIKLTLFEGKIEDLYFENLLYFSSSPLLAGQDEERPVRDNRASCGASLAPEHDHADRDQLRPPVNLHAEC